MIDADGANPTFLAYGSSPVYAPNGKKIAFTFGGNVWLMNADGSNKSELTKDGGYRRPDFSPDGEHILFESVTKGGDPKGDIFIMRSDGTDVRKLTSAGSDLYASFSPDGTKIIFATSRDG